MNPYTKKERRMPPMLWALAVLAIVSIAAAYMLRSRSEEPAPFPAAPVAYRGIIDCSQSMPCNEKYFDDAFLPERKSSQPKDAPSWGIDFQCPSDVLVYQVGTNLSVAPFASGIDPVGFGLADVQKCKASTKKAKNELAQFIRGIATIPAGHSGETNLLELLNAMRRPSSRHRLRVILATDAAQSTRTSGIDMDAKPLSKGNLAGAIAAALKNYASLPELDHAQLQFILPARAENEKPNNSQELLEQFWTSYLRQAAPTATIVNFSTRLVTWREE